MRTIHTDEIIRNVKEMCIEANVHLSDDMEQAIRNAKEKETGTLGKQILGQLCENMDIAASEQIPICQDTGMAVLFVKVGQELLRENTKDNTPAIIHYDIVPGDQLEILIAPKGFGSENMSKVFMLKPADGAEGVKNAVIEAVKDAGPNACPPIVVGVGVGGDFEKAAILAKKALTRNTTEGSSLPHIKEMEQELLERINKLGIGPGGLGGATTALAVNIETYPTHIAGLPVAVNMCCHVNRHVRRIL